MASVAKSEGELSELAPELLSALLRRTNYIVSSNVLDSYIAWNVGLISKTNKSAIEEASYSKDTKPVKKCYRCDRSGHIRWECTETRKLDGKPCNGWKPKEKVNLVDAQQVTEDIKVEVSTIDAISSSEDFVENINQEIDIHQSHENQWVPVIKNVNGPDNKIMHKLKCNDMEIEALIDTGATVSLINANIVRSNGWKIDSEKIRLAGITGDEMVVTGSTLIVLEMIIEKTKKRTTHRINVVQKKYVTLLLGLNILGKFKILVNTETKRLIFKPDFDTTGISVAEETTIQPRSIASRVF